MMNDLEPALSLIRNRKPSRIAVLTGAGISAESGIPTFRGAGGLWKEFRAEELATPEAFDLDPALVWEWYEWRRDLIRNCEPNAAHVALADLERSIGEDRFTLVTQNVDDLHRRAGNRRLLELHGNIFRVRCTADGTVQELAGAINDFPPRCRCGAPFRPDVVWFGEMLPPGVFEAAADAVSRADLLLIVGTSGTVYPAAGLAAYLEHGTSIELNIASTELSSRCDVAIAGKAAEILPRLVEVIRSVAV
ncbi:MAG: NAD-dependent deacylase [Thermoanaerobaculia bacterium]